MTSDNIDSSLLIFVDRCRIFTNFTASSYEFVLNNAGQ